MIALLIRLLGVAESRPATAVVYAQTFRWEMDEVAMLRTVHRERAHATARVALQWCEDEEQRRA